MIARMKGWRERPVGFFPFFANLAETSRLVRTAERFRELGGQAIFFSHGGAYEALARDAGFAVQPVPPIYTEAQVRDLMKFDQLEKWGDPFPDDWLVEHVLSEERAYRDRGVSLVVTGFNVPCVLSARKAQIPLVYIIPGTALPAYFKAGLATFPDTFENALTRLLPTRLKNRVTNRVMLRSWAGTGPFNRVARRFGLPSIPSTLSLWMGDYTLASDVREALEIPAEDDLREEDYIGPLLANLRIPLTEKSRAHLERPGRSIYFAMGSSGNKGLYLRALLALARTRYNVVAAYTTILREEELPSVGENVLLEKFVPAEIVNKLADLAVLHGGQGTFYTAAYSGRPVVGIPMQPEQQYNIDILVRSGSAIRLSKRHFREEWRAARSRANSSDRHRVPWRKRRRLGSTRFWTGRRAEPANRGHDVLRVGAGPEGGRHALLAHAARVGGRHHRAAEHHRNREPAGPHPLHQLVEVVEVLPGVAAQSDHVDSFLDRGLDDVGGQVEAPDVHHLHPGIAQRARDGHGTSIVLVHAQEPQQDLDRLRRRIAQIGASIMPSGSYGCP
jgi:UDP:flavonoid glycosyltransferase YjiC (YdhE family)